MIPNMIAALRHIRDDLANLSEPLAVGELCQSRGHRWRQRLLDPVTTIHLFLLQLLHGNTACAHLPRLTGRSFTPSAYRQARARLALAICQALLERLADTVAPLTDAGGLWHRTWLVDGSRVTMLDTPALQAAFGQPPGQRPGYGFQVVTVLALFHAGTGLLRHLLTGPRRAHDLAQVARVHPAFRAGDVVVGDRAFGSFAHLAMLVRQGLRVPHAPEVSRGLHPAPPGPTALAAEGAARPRPVSVGAAAGGHQPGRGVVQAIPHPAWLSVEE